VDGRETAAPSRREPRARELARVVQPTFVRAVAPRMGALHLRSFSAAVAYGAFFALLPMLVLLVALLGLVGAQVLVDRALAELEPVLAPDLLELATAQLQDILDRGRGGRFGVALVVGLLVAMWGAGGAMRRITDALNAVQGVVEDRSWLHRLAVSTTLAIGAIVLLALTLAFAVLGGDAARTVLAILGIEQLAGDTWLLLRWPVLCAAAWLGIATTYRIAPSVRRPGTLATPGTLLATGSWIAFTWLFTWYMDAIGTLGAAWGAFAGIIALLVYLQYASLIVLFGALVDRQLRDDRDHLARRPDVADGRPRGG
jgi:membrane protein